MLYVKVPKEIFEYEEKIFMGMTVRQLIWGSAAVGVGILWFVITSLLLALPEDITIFGCLIFCFPLFCCGWGTYQGMPLNKYFRIFFNYHLRNNVLHYDDEVSFYERSKECEKKSTRKERRYNKKINRTIKEVNEKGN